jgi:hypothetical protein
VACSIGPGYRPGGVVVVAINLRDVSGLLIEYVITCWPTGQLDTGMEESYIEDLGKSRWPRPRA